jgi:hypothetical protein
LKKGASFGGTTSSPEESPKLFLAEFAELDKVGGSHRNQGNLLNIGDFESFT